jgi:hypothetical protein
MVVIKAYDLVNRCRPISLEYACAAATMIDMMNTSTGCRGFDDKDVLAAGIYAPPSIRK